MLGLIMYLMLWIPLRLLYWLRIWNWHITGLDRLPPRETGAVLAINHLHWLDILIVGASLPLKYRPWWIAKVEIFENPILGWWFHAMQVIPIKRGKRDLQALSAAEDVLRDDDAVLIIFPEGHRSPNAQLQEGRSGAIRLAVQARVPIIPTAVWGTEHGPKGAFRREPIHIEFGHYYSLELTDEKIPFNRMSELTDEMMVRIAALLPEQMRGVYRDHLVQSTE